MTDNRNTILAVILSGLVLLGWQYFFNIPQMEKQRAQTQQAQSELVKPTRPAGNAGQHDAAGRRDHARRHRPVRARHDPAGVAPAQIVSRDAAIAAAPRIKIETPRVIRQHFTEGRPHRRPVAGAVPRYGGSRIAGDRAVSRPRARRLPIMRNSAGSPASGTTVKIARPRTRCGSRKARATPCRLRSPVTLKYDNGDGLTFRRTIAIDDRYRVQRSRMTSAMSAPRRSRCIRSR